MDDVDKVQQYCLERVLNEAREIELARSQQRYQDVALHEAARDAYKRTYDFTVYLKTPEVNRA